MEWERSSIRQQSWLADCWACSLVGSVLIFCVGIKLVWDKRIRVANLLPAVVLAVIAAFLPINW